MNASSLEDRVATLETRYADLLKLLQRPPGKGAWRDVVGMFANDPHIHELHRETERIRDEDRQAALRGAE